MSLLFRSILLLLAFVAIALSSPGCDKSPAPNVSTEPVRLFATVQTLADLAEQVGGKYVQVNYGIENGRSLLNFEPSSTIVTNKNAAHIVLAGGSEPWAGSQAVNPREAGRVIRLDAICQELRGAGATKPLPSRNDDAQVGLEWLDPVVGQRAADELARRLTVLRPNHDRYFTARARQLNDQIDALIAEYTPRFRAAPRRRVMSLTREFDFLAERFNIDIVPVVGMTADRIGDQQVAALMRASREEHLVTLIIRVDTPPGLVRDLAERTGLRLVTMDPYGSSSSADHDSYLAVLRYNLDQLLDALGGKR